MTIAEGIYAATLGVMALGIVGTLLMMVTFIAVDAYLCHYDN